MAAQQGELELAAALADFLLLCHTDIERGGLQPLPHYLARFPGMEAHIAREYTALTTGRTVRAPDVLLRRGYRVIEELGRGGQGTVYLAEDLELGRSVAVKVLPASFGAGAANRVARLQRETAMLARVDHPGICAVYRAHLEDDPPFLVMRYVRGRTLAQLLAAQRGTAPEDAPQGLACPPRDHMGLERLLQFFEDAALALHVAHTAGIIHRDVKPANIVAGLDGKPVLLDFGLARAPAEEDGGLTRTGETLGSPAYMAPELFDGATREPDPRADVYALGITLFECLCGRRPFEAPSQQQLERTARTEPLPRASSLNRLVGRDLDVVLATAAEKEPAKRYSTALDLARDLRNVRERHPIRARAASRALRLRRWCQRNPTVATTLTLMSLSAIGLLAATVLLLREKGRTRQALLVAESHNLAASAVHDLELDPLVALREAVRAEAMFPDVHSRSALYSAIERQRVERVFDVYAMDVPRQFTPSAVTPDGRAWVVADKAGPLALYESSGLAPTWLAPTCIPSALAVDANALHAACGLKTGEVRWFDVRRGESRILSAHEGPVRALAFAASGELASGGEDGIVRVYSPGPPCERTAEIELGFVIGGLCFSPDGTWLAAWPGETPEAMAATSPAVVDVRTGRILTTLEGHTQRIDELVFSGSGSALATASDDCTVRIWDLPSGACRLVVSHPGKVHDVAFSPDDRRMLTGFDPGTPGRSDASGAWVISLVDGERLLDLRGHESRAVIAVDWSPDGTCLLTGAYDGTVRTWDADDGRPLSCLRLLAGMISDARFLDSGRRILVRRMTETLVARTCLWEPGFLLAGHEAAVLQAAFSRDGTRVASVDRDGWVLVHEVGTGALLARLRLGVCEVAFVGDGTRLLVATEDGAARLVRLDDGGLDMEVRLGTDPVRLLTARRSSEDFLVGCGTRIVRCDLHGNIRAEFVGHQGQVTCLDLSPDGRLLASGAADRSARIWDLESGACLRVLTDWSELESRPSYCEDFSVKFDPLGTRLVRLSNDGFVRCYSIPAGELVWGRGPLVRYGEARWLGEDSLLLRPKWAGPVSLLTQVGSGAPLLVPMPPTPTGLTMAMTVSPDQRLCAAAATGGRTMLWNLTDQLPWAELGEGHSAVLFTSFSPDGAYLLTAQADGVVNLWPMDLDEAARRASPSLIRPPEDSAAAQPGVRAR